MGLRPYTPRVDGSCIISVLAVDRYWHHGYRIFYVYIGCVPRLMIRSPTLLYGRSPDGFGCFCRRPASPAFVWIYYIFDFSNCEYIAFYFVIDNIYCILRDILNIYIMKEVLKKLIVALLPVIIAIFQELIDDWLDDLKKNHTAIPKV